MEVIGMEKILGKEKKETNILDLAKKGMGLETLTKALILTLQVTNKEKYEEVKNWFLDCVRETIKMSFKNKDAEERKRIKMLEELDLEIQQTKVDTINKLMEGENGK